MSERATTRERRNRVTLVVVAAMLATGAVLFGPAPRDAQAMPTIQLRKAQQVAPTFGRDPAIGISRAGRSTAAWSKVTHIQTSDFLLGGWTTPAIVPGSAGGEDARIATSPNGTTLVAWLVQHGAPKDGAIGVSVRAAGATKFGPAAYLGSIADGASNVDMSIAVNDSGRAVVAWVHGNPANTRAVHAAFRAPGSGAWSTQVVSGGSGSSSADEPSVGLDKLGRALLLFQHEDQEVSGSTRIYQSLAPAGGAFGTPVVLPPGAGEDYVANPPRVAVNPAGQAIGAWGAVCDLSECSNIFFTKVGIGSTSTGLTTRQPISNPGGFPELGQPNRKSGSYNEVTIDEHGNATVIWDASDSTIEHYEYWAVHVTPAGAVGPGTVFGTTTDSVAGDLRVHGAGAHVVTSWVSATTAGATSTVRMAQTPFPGAAVGSWTTKIASASGVDADSSEAVLSSKGVAMIVFRAKDRVFGATNAARDTSAPSVFMPTNRAGVRVVGGKAKIAMRCPVREAECRLVVQLRTRVGRQQQLIGTATAVIRGGQAATVDVRLTPLGNRLMRLASTRPVSARIRVRDVGGNSAVVMRQWTLRMVPA